MKPVSKPNPGKRGRPRSGNLVKSMIKLLPLNLLNGNRFTQEYVAGMIGCHRHWFRSHKKRYNIDTGKSDPAGYTPLEILDQFEKERTRDRNLTPREIELQEAYRVIEELKRKVRALEEKVETQRIFIHKIAINRHLLEISEEE